MDVQFNKPLTWLLLQRSCRHVCRHRDTSMQTSSSAVSMGSKIFKCWWLSYCLVGWQVASLLGGLAGSLVWWQVWLITKFLGRFRKVLIFIATFAYSNSVATSLGKWLLEKSGWDGPSALRKEPDYTTRDCWTHRSCNKQLQARHMLQDWGDLQSKNEVAGKPWGHWDIWPLTSHKHTSVRSSMERTHAGIMKRPMVKTMTIDHVDCEKHAWRVFHEQSALRTVVSPSM